MVLGIYERKHISISFQGRNGQRLGWLFDTLHVCKTNGTRFN